MNLDLPRIRRDLADLLGTDDLPGTAHVPEQLSPPCTIVAPSNPDYLGPGETFRSTAVTLDVLLVAGGAGNVEDSDAIDRGVVHVLDALDSDDDWYLVGSVPPPGTVRLNDTTYLGTVIKITADLHH